MPTKKPINGLSTDYYKNGQIKSEGNYKDCGIKDGIWTYWHKNGQKESEIKYKDGERDGKWIWAYAKPDRKSVV